MSNQTKDILETILDRLRNLASTETVIGDPVKVGDLTILPVIKMSVGFAAGGGEGSMEESKSKKGVGGGGGGGASVTPVGFIVIDGSDVKFVGIGKGKIESLFETVPELLRKLCITKKDGKKSEKDKPEKDEGLE